MKWFSVKEFLPGKEVGWVIIRTENNDGEEFVYMAIYYQDLGWKLWDEDHYCEDYTEWTDKKITHWTYMPNLTEEKE